jgi:antitoxin VapB
VGLNIKDEETHNLARRVARLTGESMTAAVNHSLRERLERISKNSDSEFVERLMKLAKETAPLWKEPYKSMDHGDLLYDENGLPK